jgi:hypothetical protein
MIKDSEIVTKKYLAQELNSLRSEIKAQFIEQKVSIIEELRAEIHQSVESAMRNMQAHFDKEIHRYIGASVENIRDENRAFRDGITMLIERTDNHEKRLEVAGI